MNNDASGRWINGTIGKVMHLEEEALELRLNDGSVVEVKPFNWNIYSFNWDDENSKVEAENAGSFKQYPLKLAWAITIHKSQGKTFYSVMIDLGSGALADVTGLLDLLKCLNRKGETYFAEMTGRKKEAMQKPVEEIPGAAIKKKTPKQLFIVPLCRLQISQIMLAWY